MARSTAPRFSTGSTPGSAMSTAQAWVLGAAPKAVAAPEKIFDAVDSCAWVSRPMTISHWSMRLASSSRAGCAQMPVGGLLVLVRGVEHAAPRRNSCRSAAARPACRRSPKPQGIDMPGRPARFAGDGVDVGSGTSAPDRRLFAPSVEGDGGRGRADDHVALLEGCGEIVRRSGGASSAPADSRRRNSRATAHRCRSGCAASPRRRSPRRGVFAYMSARSAYSAARWP